MEKTQGLVFTSDIQYFIAIDKGVGTEVAVSLPFGGEEDVEAVGIAVADEDVVIAGRAGLERHLREKHARCRILQVVLTDEAVFGKAVKGVEPVVAVFADNGLEGDDVAVEVEPHQLVHKDGVGGIEREEFCRSLRLRAAGTEKGGQNNSGDDEKFTEYQFGYMYVI